MTIALTTRAPAVRSVIYYSFCTGWVWIWSGWGFDDVIGVCAEGLEPFSRLLGASWHYIHTGAPSGYGFTGTVEVRAADANCCPTGAPFGQQPFLPVPGFNQFLWGGLFISDKFVVTMTTGPGNGSGVNTPLTEPTAPVRLVRVPPAREREWKWRGA